MGWKKLKEAFGITHNIEVTKEGVCIGSGYVPDLAVVNPETGEVHESPTFGGFLRQHYPALEVATPEEVLKVIQEPDEFSAHIPVFTYEGGTILEKLCETPGWPNTTRDGCLMYENTYSVSKEQVVRWAKHNAALAVKFSKDDIDHREKSLIEARARLVEYENQLGKLEADYPSIAVSV